MTPHFSSSAFETASILHVRSLRDGAGNQSEDDTLGTGDLSIRRPRAATGSLSDAVNTCFQQMATDAALHPAWVDRMDSVVMDAADRSELEDLLLAAPTGFFQGLVFGKLTLRMKISSVTGRPFDRDSGFAVTSGYVDVTVDELCAVIMERLQVLQKKYAAWFDLYEECDPDICSRDELEQMLASAPTTFLQGLVYGKYTMRVQMGVVTGRPF